MESLYILSLSLLPSFLLLFLLPLLFYFLGGGVICLCVCLFVCLWWRLNPEPSIYSSYHNLYQPLLVLFNRVGLSCNLLFRLARWYR